MARRKGIFDALAQARREAERRRVAQAVAESQAARAAEQARRAYERAHIADLKERARLYLESRLSEVAAQNEQLEQDVARLRHLLSDSLSAEHFVDLETLKQAPQIPPFNPGSLGQAEPAPAPEAYLLPKLSVIKRFLPGAKQKYAQKLREARQRYDADLAAHAERELARHAALAEARSKYDRDVAEIRDKTAAQHAEVEKFQQNFAAGFPQFRR